MHGDRTGILHVRSISSWTPPGGEAIAQLVERLSGRVLISLDPNIRPMPADGPVGTSLGSSTAAAHRRLDRLVARVDVAKVSAEDLAWFEPGDGDLDDAARRWASRGPGLVLLTARWPRACSPACWPRGRAPGRRWRRRPTSGCGRSWTTPC